VSIRKRADWWSDEGALSARIARTWNSAHSNQLYIAEFIKCENWPSDEHEAEQEVTLGVDQLVDRTGSAGPIYPDASLSNRERGPRCCIEL
jgi:hypothetical protein